MEVPTTTTCDDADRTSTPEEITAFRWMLLLGFSADEAAAALRPDIFRLPHEAGELAQT